MCTWGERAWTYLKHRGNALREQGQQNSVDTENVSSCEPAEPTTYSWRMRVYQVHGHLSPSQSEPWASQCLGEFQKTQVGQGVFPHHEAVSVAVSEKIPGKPPSVWKSARLKLPMGQRRNHDEIENILKLMIMKMWHLQICGRSCT